MMPHLQYVIILYFNQIPHQKLILKVLSDVLCNTKCSKSSFILHFIYMNRPLVYLCRIFSASLSDKFIPRSLSDCWISVASMRPACTVMWLMCKIDVSFFKWVSSVNCPSNSYRRYFCPDSWRSAGVFFHALSDTSKTPQSPAPRPYRCLQR